MRNLGLYGELTQPNHNLSQFDSEGYVLCKGMFSAAELSAITTLMDSSFEPYCETPQGDELKRDHAFYQSDSYWDAEKKLRIDGIPLAHRLYRGQGSPILSDTPNPLYGKRASKNFLDIDPNLDAHIFKDQMLSTAAQVLKCNTLNFLEGSMNRTYPHYAGEAGLLHIDTYGFTYGRNEILGNEDTFLNAIIYVDGTVGGRSPTRLLPGSHRPYKELNAVVAKALGVTDDFNRIHQRELYEELIPDHFGSVVEVNAEPGDVLLFNSSLVHGIPENRSDSCVRNVIILNFSDAQGYAFGKARDKKTVEQLQARLGSFSIEVPKFVNIRPSLTARASFKAKSFLRTARRHLSAKTSKGTSRLELSEMPYLNVGSGTNWDDPKTIGLDINGAPEDVGYRIESVCDIEFDLSSTTPLPFSNERFEGAYTSHCLEHLGESNVSYIAGEVARVLKPGGTFRIIVPDMDRYFDAYEKRDLKFFNWIRSKGVYRHDSWLRFITREFAGNVCDLYTDEKLHEIYRDHGRWGFIDFFRVESEACDLMERNIPDVHKSYWDANRLAEVLRTAGFSEVVKVDRYEGNITHFVDKSNKRFNCTRPEISLVVEGIK